MRQARLAAAILAALCSAPALGADEGVLVVRGTGLVEVAPDTADIVIGVETEEATAGAAVEANSNAMARIVADAARSGIERKDIQTSTLSLSQTRDSNDKIRHRAINTLRLRVRDLSRLGAAIREVVGSGANTIRGLRFSHSDAPSQLLEARKRAVVDAKRKAEAIVEAAGLHLGPVLEITDGTYETAPAPMLASSAASRAAPDVPVEAGQVALRADMQIKFRITP